MRGSPRIELRAFQVEDLLSPIPPYAYLIGELIPCAGYSIAAGALSAGKTTAALSLTIWRCTGFDILDMNQTGRMHAEPGPPTFITYEDADDIIVGRFKRIVQAAHKRILEVHGAVEGARFLRLVAKHFRRLTLTCRRGRATHRPRPLRPAAAQRVDDRGDPDRAEGLRWARTLVVIDPLRLAFHGSQNDDAGADLGVLTLNDIATRMDDSGVLALSHTTKAQAVEQGDDRIGRSPTRHPDPGSIHSTHASNFDLGRRSPMRCVNSRGFLEPTTRLSGGR